MLLAIDIGNTHTVIGVFEKKKLLSHFRIASNHTLTADECGILVKQLFESNLKRKRKIDGIIICSVVPNLTGVYQEMGLRYFGKRGIIVNSELSLPIKISYGNPKEVGADRIVNAVAAFHLFGGPAIVVDLGTATTIDVISRKGEYLGGAIAPGVETSAASLFQKAAQLSKISLERPKRAIGKTTEQSLRSGIIIGTVGQIEKIVAEIKSELLQLQGKSKKKILVIGTGGLAELISKETKIFDFVDRELTLEGLRLIYDFILKSNKLEKMQDNKRKVRNYSQ